MKRLLLPAPREPITEETAKTLFQIYGVRPFPLQIGEEPLAILKNSKEEAAVSIHTTPLFLDSFTHEYDYKGVIHKETLPKLFQVFQHLTDPGRGITFLLRAVETKYDEYNRHTLALQKEVPPTYQDFISKSRRWASPKSEGQKYTHDLIIWGPAYDLTPGTEGKTTAAIDHSTLLRYRATGSLLREVLYRLPARMKLLKPDPRTKNIPHLDFAAPDEYLLDSRYFGINHRLFGYWLGEVNPENLGPILASDIDLLMHVIYANNTFYHTALLRKEGLKPEDLDQATNVLNQNLGKWERVTSTSFSKTDLMTAFRSFIPGSLPLPESWGTPCLAEWRTVFTMMADSIRPASDLRGTMSLGKNRSIKSGSVLINPLDNPAVAVTGASKLAGKSTTTAAILLPYMPPIWIPLTVTAGDRCFDWGEKFGGTIVPLVLPDATTIMAEENRSRNRTPTTDKPKLQALQHKLHVADTVIAQSEAYKLMDSWHNHGRQIGLPFVLKPETDTIRVINYIQVFLETLAKENAILEWFKNTGQLSMFVIDNFSKLGKIIRVGNSGVLGNIPIEVANNLAQTVGDMIVNGANRGQLTWVLAHAEEDFDVIDPGYYNRFPLGIQLGRDENHEMGRVVRPNSENEVVLDQLYVHLPYEIRKEVERLELGLVKGNGHLQMEEGIETLAQSQT